MEVRFTDDEGNSEGPLPSAVTSAITAAAACPAPEYTGGATQLWTGTVGIGTTQAAVGTETHDFHGYGPGYGSLDDTSFTAATAHTVQYVDTYVPDSTGVLRFGIQGDTGLSAVEQQQLTLHVCDSPFAFNALPAPTLTPGSAFVAYEWINAVDWSTHAERTLYISRDQAAPTLTRATVDDTSMVLTFSEALAAAANLANSAFSVKKTPQGGSETTVTLDTSTAPSISRETVTLTLASGSAVSATDGSVKVTYTKPTSGMANKLVDSFGNEVATFTDRSVVNLLADSTPPALTSARPVLAADGLTITLTYNEPLRTTPLPAASAFTVEATPQGGSEGTVDLADMSPVTVSGSTVVLKLAKPLAHNDRSVKVSYAQPSSDRIADTIGNPAPSFTDQLVANNSVVPRVSIVEVRSEATPGIADAEFLVERSNFSSSPLAVQLTFQQADDYLASTSQTVLIPANMNKVSQTFPSSYTGNVSGDLTATVAGGVDHLPAVNGDAEATVAMKLPPSGKAVTVRFVDDAVTVTEGETAQLMVRFLTGDSVVQPRIDILVNVIAEPLTARQGTDYESSPTALSVAPGAWTRIASGQYERILPFRVQTIDEDDDQHEAQEEFTATLLASPSSDAVDSVDTATITINDDDPLDLREVTVTSTPGNGSYYDAGEAIKFSLTFSGSVTVTGTPRFGFRLGGQPRTADYESGSTTEVLVFSYTVVSGDTDHDGISWPAGEVALNGGAIKFTHPTVAEQVDSSRTHGAESNQSRHRVDSAAPSLESATLVNTVLTLVFSETLNSAAPASTAFTVTVDGSTNTVNDVAIQGPSVRLTLATAVISETAIVSVSYVKPSTNPIRDRIDREADAFTNESVTVEANERPTSAGESATTTAGTPLTFNRSRFTYMDAESDEFESVRVVTLPSLGRLLFDGVDVTAGQQVDVSDIDAGSLRYQPPASVGGAVDDSFTFRVVSDNGRESAATYTMTITVTQRPAPPPLIGIGGGGGPSGPTPSEMDFEWTVEHDIEELDSDHDVPTGSWSDGGTLWLLQNGAGADDAVYAYDLDSGERVEEREFTLDERNRAPRGVWSDDEGVVWVSDSGRDTLFAYDLSTGGRLEERDIVLTRRNRDARGIWSDGTTMWVLNRNPSLFAYDLESGAFLAEYALDDTNGDPHGIWSDGVSVWVSNHDPKRLFAYRLPVPPSEPPEEPEALERVTGEEFEEPGRVGNNSPRGIWSDGAVMYVADENDGKVYSYNMPDAIDARLASLTLEGVEFGDFSAARRDYEGVVGDGVTETTVGAQAVQDGATLAINPVDADPAVEGHQVALAGVGEIAVTVTSPDGSRERVYSVRLGEAAQSGPSASCLRGAVSVGFSLAVSEGGSVDDLVACAESRAVTALYVLDDGTWVSHIVGAPDFVNAPFRELFADGVAALTPLTVKSEGPSTPAPEAHAVAEPFDACLRGEIARGFSLVVYEGGSVEELASCAEANGIAAIYVLDDGEWVSYILGAPEFVNRPFAELFPEGVPAATPLTVRSESP